MRSNYFENKCSNISVNICSLFRQDLIIDLRKAKAVRGAAGFKGMQITEVVKCVEDTVKVNAKTSTVGRLKENLILLRKRYLCCVTTRMTVLDLTGNRRLGIVLWRRLLIREAYTTDVT